MEQIYLFDHQRFYPGTWPTDMDMVLQIQEQAAPFIQVIHSLRSADTVEGVLRSDPIDLDNLVETQMLMMNSIINARNTGIEKADMDTITADRNLAAAQVAPHIFPNVNARATERNIDRIRYKFQSWTKPNKNKILHRDADKRDQGKKEFQTHFQSLLVNVDYATTHSYWSLDMFRRVLRTLNNITNNLVDIATVGHSRNNSQGRDVLRVIVEQNWYNIILRHLIPRAMDDFDTWRIVLYDEIRPLINGLTRLREALSRPQRNMGLQLHEIGRFVQIEDNLEYQFENPEADTPNYT
jgi:hypothetical protein